jgi:hypothetical protein
MLLGRIGPAEACQPRALGPERFGLTLERLSLAFQLQLLAVSDLFEKADDRLRVALVHGFL